MLVCLLPVVLSLFVAGIFGSDGSLINGTIFAGELRLLIRADETGTLLSRIGMWSFDLCQLKLLQLALEDHPYRNRLAALQLALQNLFSLLRFASTMLASRPSNFKWTGAVSWLAILGGTWCYVMYLRRVRAASAISPRV